MCPAHVPTLVCLCDVLLGGCQIFLGGVSFATTEETLRTYLEGFGPVVDVVVMKDKYTGTSRGFGFATFQNAADAAAALASGVPKKGEEEEKEEHEEDGEHKEGEGKKSKVRHSRTSGTHLVDGRRVEMKRATPRSTAQSSQRAERNAGSTSSRGRSNVRNGGYGGGFVGGYNVRNNFNSTYGLTGSTNYGITIAHMQHQIVQMQQAQAQVQQQARQQAQQQAQQLAQQQAQLQAHTQQQQRQQQQQQQQQSDGDGNTSGVGEKPKKYHPTAVNPKKIFVGGLPPAVTNELFEVRSKISRIWLMSQTYLPSLPSFCRLRLTSHNLAK